MQWTERKNIPGMNYSEKDLANIRRDHRVYNSEIPGVQISCIKGPEHWEMRVLISGITNTNFNDILHFKKDNRLTLKSFNKFANTIYVQSIIIKTLFKRY